MKLGSAPLDDVYQEYRFVLEQDGGRLARIFLRFAGYLYRLLHGLLLAALRLPWSSADVAGGRP